MPKLDPEEAEEIAPGTVIDGRYKVVRPIGQGGNGLVYEVEHARTGRRLALKVLLDETGFARLEQEARAASLMKNGHTARIIDMEPGNDTTGPYMVMELLEGQSLRVVLDEAGQLPLELTVNIAMQVCECLHESHGLGIIHRDLKPENVFLCPSPWPGQYDVKVLDFGVMKMAGDGGAIPKSSLTRTGSTVGTPYYMSLEQLRNSSAVDARADVYSLGVVLYEMLSGRKPFQADTIGDLVYALCSGPPTALGRLRPDLPAEVAEIVMRTLSANRDDRPPTMLALATSLLSHANAAFALWVKVDGKQPALAPRAPTSSIADPPSVSPRPGPLGAAPRPVGRAPAVSMPTSVLAPLAASTPSSVSRAPRPGGSAIVPAPEASAGPQTQQGWPAAPVPMQPEPQPEPEPAGARRDTPTEMYVKGTHGVELGPPTEADEDEGEGEGHGDRDTPTRAYSIDPPRRANILETMKSPVAAGSPAVAPTDMAFGATTSPLGNVGDLGLFENGPTQPVLHPGGSPAFGAQPGAPAAMLSTQPIHKKTMPLGVMLGQLPPPPAPAAAPAPASAARPPAPGWQASLDRALIGVGRFSEAQVLWFRSAHQNTQIIVVIIAGTIAILVLGFLAFLLLH